MDSQGTPSIPFLRPLRVTGSEPILGNCGIDEKRFEGVDVLRRFSTKEDPIFNTNDMPEKVQGARTRRGTPDSRRLIGR